MEPTLRGIDFLEIEPYRDRPVQIGDIIAFFRPEVNTYVVHRVIQSTSSGVRTKGDNCLRPDSWRIPFQDVEGRAVAGWRGKRRIPLHPGKKGLYMASLCRLRETLLRVGFSSVEKFYDLICRLGIIARISALLLPRKIAPRVILFRTTGYAGYGQAFILMGGRQVGRYDAHQEGWQIRKPYRLFVNEKDLPLF